MNVISAITGIVTLATMLTGCDSVKSASGVLNQALEPLSNTSVITNEAATEVQTYQQPFNIADEGEYEIIYYGVDKVGNKEVKSILIFVDNTLPVFSGNITRMIQAKSADNILDRCIVENNVVFARR